MSQRTYDFDLHGLVGIRLVEADPHDLAVVERQLGPLRGELHRTPDITVRFVNRVTSAELTYVSVLETGFNGEGFFLLQGRGGVAARTLVPFADVGHPVQVVCERGVPAVPHLLTLINLAALTKDVLPLHASAFTIDDTGVLVTGWSKGGKTETLLEAARRGARYVGDEWVYLTPDGRMFGLPEPIRVWAWQLDQLPELLRARRTVDRLRMRGWRATASAARLASTAAWPGAAIARKGAPIIERQAYLQIPPAELFGREGVQLSGRLDVVVLVVSHSAPDTTVSTVSAADVAHRMTASLAEERAAFMAHYRQFRFAFPRQRNHFVESAAVHEARLLTAVFEGRPAVTVAHPYPCDLRTLGQAVLTAATAVAPAVPTHPVVGAS